MQEQVSVVMLNLFQDDGKISHCGRRKRGNNKTGLPRRLAPRNDGDNKRPLPNPPPQAREGI